MNVVLTYPVEIGLRSLTEDDRKRVTAWFPRLEKWKTDDFIRNYSHKLDGDDNVYMLKASPVYRIFFQVDEDRIEVLDIATRDTLLLFQQGAGRGRK